MLVPVRHSEVVEVGRMRHCKPLFRRTSTPQLFLTFNHSLMLLRNQIQNNEI